MKNSSNRVWHLSPLHWAILVSLALYLPWIVRGQFSNWDLNLVLDPLRPLHSLSDYFHALRVHWIFDFQPIRDLSYAIDLRLEPWTGPRIFQCTQLLVFFGILAWVDRLLKQVLGSESKLRWGLVAFAVHPAFVNIVCWIAARKHLLSGLFILGATSFFLDQLRKPTRKNGVLSLVFYLASILSQPITILWPLWAGAVAFTSGKWKDFRVRAPVFTALGFGALIGVFNSLYYGRVYAQQTGIEKWVPFSLESLKVGFLAQGRYFWNLLCPIHLLPLYGIDSHWNLLGLVLGLAFVVLAWRALGPKRAWPWVLFYFLPLWVVTFPMTHVFVLDAYLLTPSAGILILALEWLRTSQKQQRVFKWIGGSLIPLFLMLSLPLTRDWERNSWLWKRTLVERQSTFILVKLADALQKEGEWGEARAVIERIEKQDPSTVDLPLLASRAIYFDPSLSWPEKLTAFQSKPWGSGWFLYYRASVLGALSRFDEAFDDMTRALKDTKENFGSDLPPMVAEIEFLCEKAKRISCGQWKNEVRALHPIVQWNEATYQARKRQLLP